MQKSNASRVPDMGGIDPSGGRDPQLPLGLFLLRVEAVPFRPTRSNGDAVIPKFTVVESKDQTPHSYVNQKKQTITHPVIRHGGIGSIYWSVSPEFDKYEFARKEYLRFLYTMGAPEDAAELAEFQGLVHGEDNALEGKFVVCERTQRTTNKGAEFIDTQFAEPEQEDWETPLTE